MPLYKTTATIEIYFYQDKEPTSYEVSKAMEHEWSNIIDEFETSEVTKLEEVSMGWQKSIPYGGSASDNRTVADLLITINNK